MTIQHIDKEHIRRIIDVLRKYSENDYIFTNHYDFTIKQRDIKHNFLLETFKQFEKIKMIEEDILSKGDTGYDLYYEMNNSKTLIVGVCPKNKLIFTHGIMRYRKWQSSVKKK